MLPFISAAALVFLLIIILVPLLERPKQTAPNEAEARELATIGTDRLPPDTSRTHGVFAFGDGSFSTDVVGESFYQDIFRKIAGPETEDSHEHYITAVLKCDNRNEFDAKAVAVQLHGMTVGYLSKNDARSYRAALRRAKFGEASCAVNAVIRGGWVRRNLDKDDEDYSGLYGIFLDMDMPPGFSRIK